jgi:hypothetical protein
MKTLNLSFYLRMINLLLQNGEFRVKRRQRVRKGLLRQRLTDGKGGAAQAG